MLVLEWNHQFHRMRRGSGQEASEGWPIVMFIMCARGHSEPVVGLRKGRAIWIKKQDSSNILHATTGFIIEEKVAMRVDSLAKFVTCIKYSQDLLDGDVDNLQGQDMQLGVYGEGLF